MTLTLQPSINLHTLNTVNQTYQPQLLFNDYKQGMKLSYEIIQQLNSCDSFQLSIAFISLSIASRLLFSSSSPVKATVL